MTGHRPLPADAGKDGRYPPTRPRPNPVRTPSPEHARSIDADPPRRPRPGPSRPQFPPEAQELTFAPDDATRSTASFRSLLANPEFRAMWVAVGQSQFGDQLGRVALSILVFTTTGSGLVTAGVYALTYVPTMLGGILLSGLADRYPRRTLLVTCDLIRAALFALMALPSVPVWGVAALLTLGVMVGAPHKAAEPAVVADMYDGDQYTAALGIRTATAETAQLLGFALGGLIVAAIGSRAALAIDAATFALSAALLRAYLTDRPAARATDGRRNASVRDGLHTVFGDPRLRALLGFSWLAGCWVVPEGLAAPYAAEHGGGPAAVGLLLATDAIGVLLGSLTLSRCVPARRRAQALGPLAIASGVPLMLCAYGPGIATTFGFWTACGLLSSYQVLVVAEFVPLTPVDRRGQAIGIAASGLLAVQGLGIALGGALAAVTGTAPAVALAGATGTVLAVLVTVSWSRARQAYRLTVTSAQA